MSGKLVHFPWSLFTWPKLFWQLATPSDSPTESLGIFGRTQAIGSLWEALKTNLAANGWVAFSLSRLTHKTTVSSSDTMRSRGWALAEGRCPSTLGKHRRSCRLSCRWLSCRWCTFPGSPEQSAYLFPLLLEMPILWQAKPLGDPKVTAKTWSSQLLTTASVDQDWQNWKSFWNRSIIKPADPQS